MQEWEWASDDWSSFEHRTWQHLHYDRQWGLGHQWHWDNSSWSQSSHDTQSRFMMPGAAPTIDFRPPWCTDNDPRRTVEVWYDELVGRFECDNASIRELYGLAHLSQRGYEEANDIFWKMCKKVCDDEHIDNPSAFLHRGVKTAREKMQGTKTHLVAGHRIAHQ